MAVNVNELTYGIEIECYLPSQLVVEGRLVIGGYHHGAQVPDLPDGWNAQSDGSLHDAQRGFIGVEIVSPVLKGADGLRQILAVCEWLKANQAYVNKTCGFHVHVGFDRQNAQALKRLVHLVSNFERALYASTGTHNRERSHFCASIQRSARHQAGEYTRAQRYHVLNLTNLLGGNKPTVEFRAFAGTTNCTKILGHVRQCLALVEKALELTRLPAWAAKATKESSPLHRKGEGSTALVRFLYRMGWTRGQSDKVYGNIQADGCPGIEECKRELLRLAKDYDKKAE